MPEPMIANGTVYGAEHDAGDYRILGELVDPYPELQQHTSGSRTYWCGVVYAREVPESTLAMDMAHVWIGWHGKTLRVDGWRHTPGGDPGDPGRRPYRLECSQLLESGAAVFDNYHQRVRLHLLEPSPPRPIEEWLDRERARAIRELVGDGRRPHVRVPTPRRGELVTFDPWAPEFVEVTE